MSSTASQPGVPERVVLEGVPRLEFYKGGPRCPEDLVFPSTLRAYLEYMGESLGCKHVKGRGAIPKVDCAYAYIMGLTGEAFMMSWSKTWDAPFESRAITASRLASYNRAVNAVGHSCEAIFPGDVGHTEAHLRSIIIDSIRRGCPVIVFSAFGPSEAGLVTGYDEGGDVLLGWNHLQDAPDLAAGVEYEPTGYYRKRNWYHDQFGVMLIGDKVDKPSLQEIGRRALRQGLELMRTPIITEDGQGRFNGLAAYQAWSDALRPDESFPQDDLALLRRRHGAHDDAVGWVAEARWYGSLFLRQLARQDPTMADELSAAAKCFEAEHDLMWAVWYLLGGNGRTDEHARRMASHFLRDRMAPIILLSRDQDQAAADYIERALAT